ncbi:MAG: tRNA (adenosine(37)-N6)-dimethylallyltransferase MiaA [Tannerella sp.]|jgi:tRNA dimethylallyltransferase|nr:tRNA (adenosine(37)-N6)-dimethylallyltransferase MiaA [Tannerella sp.]
MNTLIVLLGPTAVGKTAWSLRIARKYGSPVISADSRQLYKDLAIGTAAPTPEQLAQATHFMVSTLALTDYYSASRYEEDVMELLAQLFKKHPVVLLSGGSMMYLDAVCKGIDEIPTVSPDIRQTLRAEFEQYGLEPILEELKMKDPQHYEEVDRKNYRRVIHAVEICRMAGRPYSSFRMRQPKERPFRIVKIGLTRPRAELCERINQRVDQMMADGLENEARKVYPLRHLNALNTVGYKELFQYFEGEWPLETAVEKIKRNTRVYARKQMTWFKRDNEINWFHPDDEAAIFHFLDEKAPVN